MSTTQPAYCIEYTRKEVDRYREDVDDWKQRHDVLAHDCWVWEEIFLKANSTFSLILKLDLEVQKYILIGRSGKTELQEMLRDVLAKWLETSLELQNHAARLQGEYGEIDGANELNENVTQAQAILTPDDEYFSDDKLFSIRDKAIEANRAGMTEPFLDHERVH